MIKEAAIRLRTGTIVTGKRHHTIFAMAKTMGIPRHIFKKGTQGFVDEKGNFLNQKEAGVHAYGCGQIKEPTDCLVSEDLY